MEFTFSGGICKAARSGRWGGGHCGKGPCREESQEKCLGGGLNSGWKVKYGVGSQRIGNLREWSCYRRSMSRWAPLG